MNKIRIPGANGVNRHHLSRRIMNSRGKPMA